jgi:hypothetical protein
MKQVNNYNDLSRVFNTYNITTIEFRKKLTIVVPTVGDIDKMLQKFMSNVELSRQHEYVGSLTIDGYNIFNDLPMYTMLLDSTNLANNIMTNSDISILNSNKELLNVWKIFIVDNVMWNLPFTLEDVIFIPLKQMKKNLDIDSYYDLTRTLIHERIHTLQRLNPKEWIDYVYYKNKQWILVEFNTPLFNFLNDYNVNKLMEWMQVINPDTVYSNFKYVYKMDEKLYYGVLYLNQDKNIKIQWFRIHDKKNQQYDKENFSFYLEKLDKEILDYEHPFEEYAYKISEELVKVDDSDSDSN